MAYSKSKARASLEASLADVTLRVRSAQTKGIPVDVKEYAIAAAIFLAHAELENYIEDSFSSIAKGVVVAYMSGSPIPKDLRAHLFLTKSNLKDAFGKFLGGSSEKDLIKAVRVALDGDSVNLLFSSAKAPFVSGKDIYGMIKYPSERNLAKLFSRLGINKVFDELSKHLKQDSKVLLESIGSLRTQLAHTGALPGVSPKDVRKKIDDTARFVRAMDRVLYSFLCGAYSELHWKTYH